MSDIAKYKLLAVDIDGTLLNDQHEISPDNAEWIQKAIDAGVTVCLSTGRGKVNALPFAEQLRLESPMITVNGGEIWLRPHVLHKRTTLSPQLVARLYRLAKQHDEPWFWAYSTDGLWNKEKWLDAEQSVESFEWLKFGYYTEVDATREALFAELRSWDNLEISNSSPYNIELNPLGVSKASGMKELCSLLRIEMSETVAVGDSLNDIAAIRESGLGVAMGNAQDAVKSAADVVTASNEEHGVAELIQRYIL